MDWRATLEEILAERRRRFGEPPAEEDLIALRAGELADDDRRRLLEHAAVDPEVARELFAVLRFPEADDDSPEADESGVGRRWRALRDRLETEGDLPAEEAPLPPVPLPRRPAWLPLAAMFLLGVTATLLVDRARRPSGPGAAGEARVNLPIVELLPVGDAAAVRGAERVTVAADAGGLVLTLAVPGLPPAPGRGPYSLELTRGDGTTAAVAGLAPGVGGVFVLALPRQAWSDGLHQLRLIDVDGQPVARFELEVELRR